MSEVELLDGEVVEIVDVQEVGRPNPEQFGYIPKDNPEEEGGWTLEGGQEEYEKALASWESKTPETPAQTIKQCRGCMQWLPTSIAFDDGLCPDCIESVATAEEIPAPIEYGNSFRSTVDVPLSKQRLEEIDKEQVDLLREKTSLKREYSELGKQIKACTDAIEDTIRALGNKTEPKTTIYRWKKDWSKGTKQLTYTENGIEVIADERTLEDSDRQLAIPIPAQETIAEDAIDLTIPADEELLEAARLLQSQGEISANSLQRQLKIGFNKATEIYNLLMGIEPEPVTEEEPTFIAPPPLPQSEEDEPEDDDTDEQQPESSSFEM